MPKIYTVDEAIGIVNDIICKALTAQERLDVRFETKYVKRIEPFHMMLKGETYAILFAINADEGAIEWVLTLASRGRWYPNLSRSMAMLREMDMFNRMAIALDRDRRLVRNDNVQEV